MKHSLIETYGNNKYISLLNIANIHDVKISSLPYCLRILLENAVRYNIKKDIDPKHCIDAFKNWLLSGKSAFEVDFMPTRILMQDFTGVPAIVDLAAMRDAIIELGGNAKDINPLIPIDLVIDHSIQVDYFKTLDALSKNTKIEFERNYERYKFLRWGQQNFNNLRVVPPSTGICHQVNLEYLAKVVWQGSGWIYPDSLVGTDSHTTMINGLSVLGWGVGGIEAEAAMLGEAISMIIPEVIGVKLEGLLTSGVTATDLVLFITNKLRKFGVVGKFVEYFGSGIKHLNVANRATIANMSPEYGATCGFFPIDNNTIDYLQNTGRNKDLIELVEDYSKLQQLFYNEKDDVKYTEIITIDLSQISPAIAGPKRPQDLLALSSVKDNFLQNFNVTNSKSSGLGHGDVVIAAITSCTNTSNPEVMVAAGLMAKKAVELGLKTKDWVKTSLAPGSQVVSEYLKLGGLQDYLDQLGFNIVGYGCTTCIGNSGPIAASIEQEIAAKELIVASVLSGNRNFEARVHNSVKANYLASPPLVIAYAIAGTINIDISKEAIGKNKDGTDVFLKDLWPSSDDINSYIKTYINKDLFTQKYSTIFNGDQNWQNITNPISDIYPWDENSSYIKKPPYFDNIKYKKLGITNINNACILAIFGDSITTDHISPAGNIPKASVAGLYLLSIGVDEKDFNSYGARRGNHEVMMRGTFANRRIKNEICKGKEGGITINQLTSEVNSIYEAAMDYQENNIPSVIIAGLEYGTGSSRDWAAKGPKLLGVKCVIASSFERIHRSNLVGMGIVPLTFTKGDNRITLDLKGDELINIELEENFVVNGLVTCTIEGAREIKIMLKLEIYTENEINCIKAGGILHKVISQTS